MQFYQIAAVTLSLWLFPMPALADNTQTDWNGELSQAQQYLQNEQYDEAIVAFTDAATRGNGLAQFTLGLINDYGWGVPVSRASSCEWYLKSAQLDVPMAAFKLGQCYQDATWKSPDLSRALSAFNKALGLGILNASIEIANIQIHGSPQDKKDAVALLIQSSNSGNTNASLVLAKWYFHGTLLAKDYTAAYNLLSLSDPMNQPEAAWYLAQFYDRGLVKEKDIATAAYWYEIAASQHFEQAYLPAALLYYELSSRYPNHYETLVSKAYLWATVAYAAGNKSKAPAEAILNDIKTAIPSAWSTEFDKKAKDFLALGNLHQKS